ncbi:MAG: hypothetical protein LUI09_02130 [Prevotellaceae bacterium]|nr:hypothetical protein [Prevotellaceae bacterium]
MDSMQFNTKYYDGTFDPFWRGEAKMLPGGFRPTNGLPDRCVVRRGTLVQVEPDDLSCVIAKAAAVLSHEADADGNENRLLRVAKGTLFVVGDEITSGTAATTDSTTEGTEGEGGEEGTDSVISTASATAAATNGSGTALLNTESTTTENTATITAIDRSGADHDVLTLSAALTGDNIYASGCEPNAVVAHNYENTGLGAVVLDCAYETCLLYKALPYDLKESWKNGINLAANPSIKLITQ